MRPHPAVGGVLLCNGCQVALVEQGQSDSLHGFDAALVFRGEHARRLGEQKERCPVDGGAFVRFAITSGESGQEEVLVEGCEDCGSLLLDPGEGARLSQVARQFVTAGQVGKFALPPPLEKADTEETQPQGLLAKLLGLIGFSHTVEPEEPFDAMTHGSQTMTLYDRLGPAGAAAATSIQAQALGDAQERRRIEELERRARRRHHDDDYWL